MNYKALTEDNCKDFKNFKYKEFKCHCKGRYCDGYPVAFSYELAKNLQRVRDHFGKPLVITSPIRCQKWNDMQKGSIKHSRHTKGWATDFYIKGVSYKELYNYVKKLPYFHYAYQTGTNVIHYDITPPENSKYNLTRILKKGCRGNDVKELQNTVGTKVDGIFGNNTRNAVIKFQKSKKLTADGIAGKNTAHALGWTFQGK